MTCPRERFHRNGVWCKGCEQIVQNPYQRSLKPRARGVSEMTRAVTEVSLQVVAPTPLQEKVEALVQVNPGEAPQPFRHAYGLDREAPLNGGLMLTPRAADCLVERFVWNALRRLEDTVWKTLRKLADAEEREAERERRQAEQEAEKEREWHFQVNEHAVWTLGTSGAHACWNLEGKKRKSLPTLDGYDGNWGFNG